MCQYFSKTQDQCSQAMKQVAKEAFDKNMHHHDSMKTIAQAYLSNRESSVPKEFTILQNVALPGLKLRRMILAVQFVSTNSPDERVQVLLSEQELSELPDDRPTIFRKSNIHHYMERPSATISDVKYSILDDF